MAVVIDKKIKVPLHYQIYLDLLKKIQTGVLKAGEKLPTEAELEEMYGVSRITVRGAIEMLAQEGLVEKNRGKRGTIVYIAFVQYNILILPVTISVFLLYAFSESIHQKQAILNLHFLRINEHHP